jgi:hypothetical protein
VAEWHLTSGKQYADPFNEVEVDVVFTAPDGAPQKFPAFWAGGQSWGFRYSSTQVGTHHFKTVCSDAGNADLHGIEGSVEVTPYEGNNPLLTHGPLHMAADRRHLEHADGTPFFWLGDTWWMGLCNRLQWPDEFREIAADRVAKGFTLIQIVAGLYPDMDAFDPRGLNEAGYPWQQDWSRINPEYFDAADVRIAYLVRAGLVPCVVGCWGYYLDFAGDDVIKKHWRNLVARWGAYPVVWCVAGEALMFYYLKHPPAGQEEAKRVELRGRWAAIASYISSLDDHKNPVTIHPTSLGHDQVSDPNVLDVDMLQTGHSGYTTLPNTIDRVEESLAHEPKLPVLVGEVNYEGIMESSREDIQRFLFWTCMLTGAAGHTYGANGIWQLNRKDKPYGASPHGTAWGGLPWDDAYRLAGSKQIGLAKRLLERYDWWCFEKHDEWIEPRQTKENRIGPYAAGIPGKVRVIYIPPASIWAAWSGRMFVKELEPGKQYHATLFDPKTGQEHDLGRVTGDAEGNYKLPKPPVFQDYVLVLEAV